MPNNIKLRGRLLCFASSLMCSVLAVRLFLSSSGLLLDEQTSAIAFVSLLLSSVVVGTSLLGERDLSLPLGAVMGVPFGFFFCQAIQADSQAIASGADRILMLAGILVAVLSLWPWLKQKFSTRFG